MTSISINPGLEGIYLTKTKLSDIKGDTGELTLAGFPLEQIAQRASFEEMLYLMWYDQLPTKEQLEDLTSDLAAVRELPEVSQALIREYADNDPMEVLRMVFATIPSKTPDLDCLRAVAVIPTIIAYQWRYQMELEPIEPDSSLDHISNFIQMAGLDDRDRRVRALTTYLNTIIEHGMNASTFTARTIISTDSDVISAITGAIGALKGPKHGGAPGPVLHMLKDIASTQEVESWLQSELEAGKRLMGFGHRVYKARDPRAAVLSDAAATFYQGQNASLYELAKEVEQKAVELLEKFKPGRNLQTNVEFYTALLLNGIGLPAEFFSTTFAMGRVGGWTAHLKEQMQNNRLIRPRAKYIGERERIWTPLDSR